MTQLKKYLPHLIVLLVLAAISMAYMSPLMEGKQLLQSDIVHFKGMSKDIVDFRAEHDEEPLWSQGMFSGMPAYQISVLYPSNWSKSILKMLNFGLPRPANYLFLLMAGAYFMFVVLRINWKLALVGAIGFGLASYSFLILEAGHNSKAHAMAFMMPVLGSILLTYRGKYLLGAGLTAFFLSLQIATNHLQITYYLMLVIIILGITKLVVAIMDGTLPNFAKASAILLVAAMFGVAPNASNLYTTYQYGKDTMRSPSELSAKKETGGLQFDYATNWSNGIAETGTLLIPNFHGGSSSGSLSEKSETYKELKSNGFPTKQAKGIIAQLPLYWGDQPFTGGPVYLGALMMLLAFLGMLAAKGRDKWWLFAAFILSIVLSWGHNFPSVSHLFFDYFPGYNKFRAVSMTLVIAQMVIPILAVFGLNAFITSEQTADLRKKLLISLGVVGGFCLLFVVMPGMFFDFTTVKDAGLTSRGYPEWLVDAIVADREGMMRSDAMRSLIFILIGGALLYLFSLGKLKSTVVVIGLACLALVDGFSVGKRYLNDDDFVSKRKVKEPYTMSQANKEILRDTDLSYRVFNVAVSTFNDASTSYFHQSIGGYHGAKMQRYQELIDSCIGKNNVDVLSMLNAKYFIVSGDKGGAFAQINPGALGNAWFVKEYQVVANADEEMAKVKSFKPKFLATIDQRYVDQLNGFQPQLDSTATITLTKNELNHLVYETSAATDQLAVFSEIYYEHGWNAYVDGELKPHWRADYVLRSMIVPAGEHTVEFKFEPSAYTNGETVSLIGSIAMLLFFVGGVAMGRGANDETEMAD